MTVGTGPGTGGLFPRVADKDREILDRLSFLLPFLPPRSTADEDEEADKEAAAAAEEEEEDELDEGIGGVEDRAKGV